MNVCIRTDECMYKQIKLIKTNTKIDQSYMTRHKLFGRDTLEETSI